MVFYPPRGLPSCWSFPQPHLAFRFFWGFTHPEDPLLVGRFPNPQLAFRFFWGFTHPRTRFWLVVDATPFTLLFGPSGVLPTPRTPFWLVVSPIPTLLFGSYAVLPTPRTPIWLVVFPTPLIFRYFWGFTHPEDPVLVGRFPNPPPCFSVLLGFYPPREPPSGWPFHQPPPPPPSLAFRFFWRFTQPKDPSGWSFPRPSSFFSVLLGFYPT